MKACTHLPEVRIGRLRASAYHIPTDFPESDGTLEWKATTLVVVEAPSADQIGIGYTYADRATARLINDMLAEVVEGRDAMATSGNWLAMIGRSVIWVVLESRRWRLPPPTTLFGMKPADPWPAVSDAAWCCPR